MANLHQIICRVLHSASYHRGHGVDVDLDHLVKVVFLCTLTLKANYYLLFLTNDKITDHGMWSWKGT